MLGPKAQLMLRYPDGKREQISLPEQAKLLVSGVNRNPCLSTGELKLENFFSCDGTIEIGSSESGTSRECLHCRSAVFLPCHSSLPINRLCWLCMFPLLLGLWVHSGVFLSPKPASFFSKMTLKWLLH